MPFQQDVRIDYWNLLKRRKRSIRNFLEVNGIDNVQKFNNWLNDNTSQYIFSEDFKKEVLCHFEVKKNVETEKKIQSIESKEEQSSQTKEENWDPPALSSEVGVAEIEFSVSPTQDSEVESEEDVPYYKKSKKKKYSNNNDMS